MRFDDFENADPILVAIGAASVCWEPTPTGIFDSDKAVEVANELKRCLLKGIEEEEDFEDEDIPEEIFLLIRSSKCEMRKFIRKVVEATKECITERILNLPALPEREGLK